MKKLFKIICISLLLTISANAQSLSDLQQQNARATGYAIVAARNPGKSFSINVIKWDGVHDLEYNATNKINYSWHPQAVVKGNYFDQPFDYNNFSAYSSVILSQSEFDTYKSTGTDWWIICSTLPSFSHSGFLISENGNMGIGTDTPLVNLHIKNQTAHLRLESSSATYNASIQYVSGDQYRWELGTGISSGPNFELYNRVSNKSNFVVNTDGNVGIGTTAPDSKLTVAGNIHAQEVKVTVKAGQVPDYVFANDYKLNSLQEVEKYIKLNNHLPEIPSAQEMEKNGLMLAEMNMSLLKKMEEMTLYMIEQNKQIIDLKNRLEKVESKLRNNTVKD
jgi:hypothetical protein